MKKTLFIFLAMGIALAGCFTSMAASRSYKQLKGSGKLITKTAEIGAFDRIEARNAASVRIVAGSGPVTIKADDNVMEYMKVVVEYNVLKIGFGDQFKNISNVTLEVTVPSDGKLSGLSASGASHITADIPLTGTDIELRTSGASKLSAKVECSGCRIDVSGASKAQISGGMDACNANVSGASKLDVTADCGSCDIKLSGASKAEFNGSAHICTINISGASSLDAEAFVTKDCNVEASGASKAVVNCTTKLTARASGASKIGYTGGSQNNNIQSSGAGSVSQK